MQGEPGRKRQGGTSLGEAPRTRDLQEADPDVALMLAFQAGDDAAFDALFRRWSGPLLRFLDRMLHDAASAEELVQEAFLRVHRARERYSADARFSTWLYRIASNLALNELRRPHRRKPHTHVRESDDSQDEGGQVLVSAGPRSDDVAHDRRVHAQLEHVLAELPERQRMALWLAAVEGLSYAEVADALETTASSVKALVHRARSGLVAKLGVRGMGDDGVGDEEESP